MTLDDLRHDTVLRALKALPIDDVARADAERIRGRCHDALRRDRSSLLRPLPPVVAVLSVAYLVDVLWNALSLLG